MLNEYSEYEVVKERRLWDNVRSKSSPTRVGAEKLRRAGQEKFQNGCDVDTSGICEQDIDLEKEEAEVEDDDDDDGDIYDIWNIKV
nr:hypothetical protein [Tanacetum cinerariifolium]